MIQKEWQEKKSSLPVSLAASLSKILEMNSKYRLMLNEDGKSPECSQDDQMTIKVPISVPSLINNLLSPFS